MPDSLASLEARFESADSRQRAALLAQIANQRAAVAFDAHRAGLDWDPQRPRPIPALRKAVLFLMVKDEAEVIGQNLDHHYRLGFRRFFILDNASTDRTAELIAAFRMGHADANVFSAYDYIVGHYQALKMKALMSFMQVYLHYEDVPPEWVFFVDADEFITCASSEYGVSESRFEAMLDDPDKTVLIFHWAQCSSTEILETLPPDRMMSEAFPAVWPCMAVPVTKVAFRLGRALEPIQGNHLVEDFPHARTSAAVMAEIGFYMFHYPMRTVEQLRRKLINGNRALSATVDRDGLSGTATHWRTYHQWFEQSGDEALRRAIGGHIESCRASGEAWSPARAPAPSGDDEHHTRDERPIVDLGAPCSGIAGVDVLTLVEGSHRPRPDPDFLYGPVTDASIRHFRNDQYEPPLATLLIRDVELIGPWFGTGTLLSRGDVDFRFNGIALNPDSLESRRRRGEDLAAVASGSKVMRRVSGQSLLLANSGHQIYGHWLADFLPKLYLLDRAGIDVDQLNILLPSNMGGFGLSFLQLLGFSDERIVHYDPDRETILPDQLVVPSTLRWGGRCSPVFAAAVAFLNERIDRNNRLTSSPMKRLFLSRRESGRSGRPFLNEDLIEAAAVAAGFTLVSPEHLPLREQIALFRGATQIIGQYGSGLHATVFSGPGTIVCGLHGQLPATFDALQSGIGERLAQPTGYIFSLPPGARENPWTIAIGETDLATCLAERFPA